MKSCPKCKIQLTPKTIGPVEVMEGRFSSMEVNPLMCTPERCVAADARIMLPNYQADVV